MQISVVIPCFNAASFLGQTLASLEKAIGDIEVEVIVVDDGSTDGTLRLLEESSERYPWLKTLTQKNAGPAVARNTGAKEAQGDFLVFLDADDEMEPEALQEAATYIANSPEKDVLIGRYQIVEADGSARDMPFVARFLGDSPHVADYIRGDLAVQQGGYLIRRVKFLELEFPENLKTQEDIPFFLAILARLPCSLMEVKMMRYHRYRGVVSKARSAALHEGFANMDILFVKPYKCQLLDEFRGEIYRRKIRGLLRYCVKYGSLADLVRVYGGYAERVGGRVVLDFRCHFKFLKAAIRILSK
jgi:glycosyltransferase involved in cell wall biosynthesis